MPSGPRKTKEQEGFGARVASLRSQKGLTLAQLGKEAGVSGTCVWNWEEGNTYPRRASLARLAKALQVSTEHLLEGEGRTSAAHHSLEDEAPPACSLADLISSARETIAEAAGLPSSKVRIVLDYGA